MFSADRYLLKYELLLIFAETFSTLQLSEHTPGFCLRIILMIPLLVCSKTSRQISMPTERFAMDAKVRGHFLTDSENHLGTFWVSVVSRQPCRSQGHAAVMSLIIPRSLEIPQVNCTNLDRAHL